MNARIILMAIVWFLLLVVFSIAYLALREEHLLFAEGRLTQATVLAVRSGEDSPRVQVSYLALARPARPGWPGEPARMATTWTRHTTSRDLALSAGATVQIRQHRNSPGRIAMATAIPSMAPSPWLAVGGVVSLALGIYTLALPGMARRRRARRTSSLDIVLDALRRTRTTQLGFGLFLLGFGVGAVWLAFFVPGAGLDTTGGKVAIGLLAALFVGVAAVMLGRGLALIPLQRSWVLRTLLERPSEVEWVYKQIFTSQDLPMASAASYTVNIRFSGRRQYALQVTAEDADALLAEVSRRAPQARVGYDEAFEREYKAASKRG